MNGFEGEKRTKENEEARKALERKEPEERGCERIARGWRYSHTDHSFGLATHVFYNVVTGEIMRGKPSQTDYNKYGDPFYRDPNYDF